MEQQSSPHPARAAIEYVCRLLRSYGVDTLTPELVRQAKFNSVRAYKPLLQALHDLALCTAAGLPQGCAEGMCILRQQVQQESIDGDTLPAGAVLLLLCLLAQWGCPAGLVAQLSLILNSTTSSKDATTNSSSTSSTSSSSSHIPGSRVCLLSLAWLIGYAQLFDRALQHLQIPATLLQLLPPYPEDTSCTAAAHAKYEAAAAAAQQHAQAVQQLLSDPSASAASAAGDSNCWQQVQVAAHHILSAYRAATLRLQLLSSLLDGKEKMLHEIKELQLTAAEQQQQQQQHARVQQVSHSSGHDNLPNNSSRSSKQLLTAFELHLLLNPQLLQQHQQALQQGCSILQQQLQCILAAQTFFAWAASVIEEEQTSARHPSSTGGVVNCTGDSSTSSTASMQSSRGALRSSQQQHDAQHQQRYQHQQQHQQRQQWDVLPQPSIPDVLPLVQQLPAAAAPVAAQVLQRITKQLQQAAAAAGISSSHSGSSGVGSAGATAAAALAGLSLGSGLVTAERYSTSNGADPADSYVAAYIKAAAAAMVDSRIVPGPQPELLTLPDDVKQLLDKQQQQQQVQQKPGGNAEQGQQQRRLWREPVWHRRAISAQQPPMATSVLQSKTSETKQQQQQQQQQQKATVGATISRGVEHASVAAGATDAADVPVTAELQCVQGLAMLVAKQLAKTRATNKQHLQLASELLGVGDAGTADGGRSGSNAQLVMYKS